MSAVAPHSGRDQRGKMAWYEKVNMAFSWIAAIATAVGVYFLVQQVSQTDAALREAAESNRLTRLAQERDSIAAIGDEEKDQKLVSAAEASAKAAIDAAAAARVSAGASMASAGALDEGNRLTAKSISESALAFKNDQRARVFLKFSVVPAEPKTETDLFRWTIVPNNGGKTPALKMRSVSLPHAGDRPEAPPVWSSIKPIEGTPLSQGQTGRSFGTAEFKFNNKSGFDLYVGKKVNVYIWNRVYYCDAFERLHWVQSCVYHAYGTPLDTVGYCDTGNTTDKNDGDTQDPDCK